MLNAAEQALYNVVPGVFDGEATARSVPRNGDRVIPIGERNNTLASLAGAMRRPGFSPDAIAAALLVENQRCADPLPEREVELIARSIGRYPTGAAAGSVAPLRAFTLAALEAHVFEHRRVLLWRGDVPILQDSHIGEVYAPRGTGKTWFVQTLALVVATASEALGFRAAEPARVLHIDGEMAGPELQERYISGREKLGVATTENITIVAADCQDGFLPRLDTVEGQMLVEPFVESADLIIIDNRSTLFDPESEKDPSAWQPAQDWLLSLRRRRKAVLVVHHSNRQGGARGHSKPEDVMNLLIKLSRPEGYTADQGARFVLEFDKARGAHGSAIAPFTASLTPEGWRIEGNTEADTATRKLVEYLDLAHRAGDRPKSASKAITSARIGKSAGLKAWAALKDAGRLHQHHDGGYHLG